MNKRKKQFTEAIYYEKKGIVASFITVAACGKKPEIMVNEAILPVFERKSFSAISIKNN